MSEAAKMLMRAQHPVRNVFPRSADPSEDNFLRQNPNVSGYAADDGRVVLSPYSSLSDDQKQSVALNEAARHTQWNQGVLHSFPLTSEQEKFFERSPYASQPQQARHSVVARLISDDQSAAPYTDAQKMAAHGVLYRTLLDKPQFNEAGFQNWNKQWSEITGTDPNPDNPEHHYDYRAAYKAGAVPEVDQEDGFYHWPSQFKRPTHPNRFVDGIDTITGMPQ